MPEGEARIPKQGEKREGELRALFRRRRKPVALFVDETHNLHPKMLTGLKRLMEVIADGRGAALRGAGRLSKAQKRPTPPHKAQ